MFLVNTFTSYQIFTNSSQSYLHVKIVKQKIIKNECKESYLINRISIVNPLERERERERREAIELEQK